MTPARWKRSVKYPSILIFTALALGAGNGNSSDDGNRAGHDGELYSVELHRLKLRQFPQTIEKVEQTRAAYYEQFKKARSQAERNEIRARAREFVKETIVRDIVPAWLGMPWTMAVIKDGLDPDARVPHEKGIGISCAWFMVSVLENAGLKFLRRRTFAGTIAVHFQHSLSPGRRDIHRYWKITPAQLKQKFLKLGDGLYIVGLNCHIGFVHVKADTVNFLHSSYTKPQAVVVEPLTESQAIANSESRGYLVTPLFHDNYLITYWITGRRVPFQYWGKAARSARKPPR